MSNILYLTTMPPPALPGTDAVFQDVEFLKKHFSGQHLSLYPFNKPSRFVPYWMMGWHRRAELIRAANDSSLIHVFSAVLRPLPCVSGLNRPIVYTVTASVGARPRMDWFARHKVQIIVNTERDMQRLKTMGVERVECIRPGLDLSGFRYTEAPPPPPFRLLIGSAPWTRAQFRTKGIEALIECAAQTPDLHLVFLWRNLLLNELEKRICRAGIESRVTIHNARVDVNEVLVGCHAATVLAENERLVKAWPHSVIESLAAGKPVLLSRTIPMAEYVEAQNAGVCVDLPETTSLVKAITTLRSKYSQQQGPRLAQLAQDDFPVERMRTAYAAIYGVP